MASDFDPWGRLPEAIKPIGPVVDIESIEGAVPLDDQFGVEVPKTAPDALHEILFGQVNSTKKAEIAPADDDPANVPPLSTYAILDAAKITNLPELLEASGLSHRCMFKGDAYDELKDVAPWIVRLEDGNGFTRNLFTRSDAPWHLWDSEPGIYLRSRGSLDEMWGHFRKFTKVQDERGSTLYFRFWEPQVAVVHFDYISRFSDLADKWFRPAKGPPISTMIVLRKNGQVQPIHFDSTAQHIRSGPFVMTDTEQALLARARREDAAARIARGLIPHAPGRGLEELRTLVRSVISRFKPYGFNRKSSIVRLSWWELQHGTAFEATVPPNVLSHILNPARAEDLRIADLSREMEKERSI